MSDVMTTYPAEGRYVSEPKAVQDPGTTTAAIGICHEAIDRVHRMFSSLEEELIPVRYMAEDIAAVPKMDTPEPRCELASKALEVYTEINRLERRIIDLQRSLRV